MNEPLSTRRLEQLAKVELDAQGRYASAQANTVEEMLSMASELLALRERDRQLGLEYDAARDVVTIAGTKFSRVVLEHFRTQDGADEYFQHGRTADGTVYVTRFIGLREQLRLLRECLEARPLPGRGVHLPPDYLEWSEGAGLLLDVTADEVAREASLVEQLIEVVTELRQSARLLRADFAEAHQDAQRKIAARMFSVHEMLHLARRRLSLWGRDRLQPLAGVCMKCGCTESNACRMKDGNACRWADETETLCSRCADEVPAPAAGGAE